MTTTPTPPYKVVPVEPTREMLKQLLDVAESLQRWAKAVPQETPLPAMPGLDGDYIAQVFDRARAMLSASPALAPTDEAWRPIESAPKDGTEFIGRRGDELHLCSWEPLNNPVAEHWGCAGTWHRRSPRSGKDLLGSVFQPIEWIPMPSRPKVDTGTPSGDQNRGGA
jgi:hypothetical protein